MRLIGYWLVGFMASIVDYIVKFCALNLILFEFDIFSGRRQKSRRVMYLTVKRNMKKVMEALYKANGQSHKITMHSPGNKGPVWLLFLKTNY